jgi:hypothetical protein
MNNMHRWKFFSEDITGAHRWKCKRCDLLVKLDQGIHPSREVLPANQATCDIVIVSRIMES